MQSTRAIARLPSRAGLVLAALLALLPGAARGAETTAPRPPNILLIVIDSLRADRVRCTGSPQTLTPFIDAYAAGSTVYDRAYAPSSWTVPVVGSLFTGELPSEHGLKNFLSQLDPDIPTLAELLKPRGYATTAVSANTALREQSGFSRGFERYALVGKPTVFNPKSDGALVIDAALAAIDAVGAARPHFVYLHFMDVHMPYRAHPGLTPPAEKGLRDDDALNFALVSGKWNFSNSEVWRLKDLYEGEVRYEDGLVQKLMTGLQSRRFLDDAVVIITADHGEEFGAHGPFGHGGSLFDATLHVPLIVHDPDRPARHLVQAVQLAGLTATLLDAAGVPRPPSVHLDPLPQVATAEKPVLSQLPMSGQDQTWLHKTALVVGSLKLLQTPDGNDIAYNLDVDPFERRPAPASPALRAALAQALPKSPARQETDPQPTAAALDDATRERLRAVGYLPP